MWIVYSLIGGQWVEVDRVHDSLSRGDVLRLFAGAQCQRNYGAVKVRRP